VKGLIKPSPAKGQKIEMIGKEYYVLGMVKDPSTFPSAKSDLTMDYIRSIEHLECHIQLKSAIYSVRSELELATEKFFDLENYTKSDMPLITFSECEGGCQPMQTTLFFTSGKLHDIPTVQQIMDLSISSDFSTLSERFGKLSEDKPTLLVDFSKDFFGRKACLTVSAQLELETHLPQGKAWTMTRAVRGEPSQTSRHLCEFSMVELEVPFSTGSDDIIDVSVKYIKFCLQYALDHCKEELEYLEGYYSKPIISKLSRYIIEDFAVITHAQAVELILQQPSGTFTELPSYDSDLSSEHERFLTDTYFQKPTIVRFYPKLIKAFYMPVIKETLEESHGVEHVDSFDILVPDVGELVGGSQRIDDYAELMTRISELGLDPEPLKFYTDLRKSGSIPHGGMGLGFERLVKFVTSAESVKDCVPYPRFIGSGKKHA
jgi:asparaginyl-tRNA synthetase